MKNIQKELDYWRNPEVMEAEEELECLHDDVPLHIPANKGRENVTVSLPEDPSPFSHKGKTFSQLVAWKEFQLPVWPKIRQR